MIEQADDQSSNRPNKLFCIVNYKCKAQFLRQILHYHYSKLRIRSIVFILLNIPTYQTVF